MDGNRRWTQEETDYIREAWGETTLKAMAAHLQRTENAIIIRAQRLKLGAFHDYSDYVTWNKLSIALGRGSSNSYQLISWVKSRGLPIHTKRLRTASFRVVYLQEFWDWAEQHRTFVDWSKVEPHALGAEPLWVAEQRKRDYEKHRRVKTTPWSKDEDNRLVKLLNEFKYTYLDISKMLGRSSGAIQRRVCDLGIKARPLKADNMIKWSESELSLFAELIKKGYDYETMGDALGRSGKALRGKVGAVYQTENLDAVRQMIGQGRWGDGAPPKGARKVGRKPQSRVTKLLLSELCGLLNARIYQISPHVKGWDSYFQRFSCMNWDDKKGCTIGECDCDSCKSYQRILPQFCKRCGSTFFERREQDVCSACRKARISQHMRKMTALQQKFKKG